MKSAKTTYLIARTHGLRPHLLRPEDFARLLMTKDMVEMVDLLLKTEYASELSKIPMEEVDADHLERIFYQNLSDRFAFLLRITGGKIKDALEDYYRRIEVENIKRILRAKHGKESMSEGQLLPYQRKYQKANLPALLETRTVAEAIGLLRETPYSAVGERIDLYEKYSSPLVLEAYLDKTYYRSLWGNLGKVVDAGRVKELIGTEIDLKNILYLLSFKRMKMERELPETIIDIHYKLPKDLAPKVIAVDFETVPEMLMWPSYVQLARKTIALFEEEKLTEAEQAFYQYLYSFSESIMLENPNSLVYVFAYLQLCVREERNLTALAVGKQLRTEEGKIQSLLFL